MRRIKILKEDEIILSKDEYEEIYRQIRILDRMNSDLRHDNLNLSNNLIFDVLQENVDISKRTLIAIINSIANFRETHSLGPNEIIIMASPEAQFTKIFHKVYIGMQKYDINITK